MYIPIITSQITNTVYAVILQDLIFHGSRQLGKDFFDFVSRLTLWIVYKGKHLDENFTCSKVTTKSTKLMFLENYYI